MSEDMMKPIAPALKVMEVGGRVEFPLARTLSVHATITRMNKRCREAGKRWRMKVEGDVIAVARLS